MSDELPACDHPGVKQTVDRNAKGREAPMVIGPRDLVRLASRSSAHSEVATRGGQNVTEERRTTAEEARRVGDAIGVDWSRFELEQFRAGMDVELEHGSHDPQTDVTGDDPILTGKIALAHMKEFPDYYERLERMEREAERDWAGRLP
jgi:Protein of unknown function (DUF5661)